MTTGSVITISSWSASLWVSSRFPAITGVQGFAGHGVIDILVGRLLQGINLAGVDVLGAIKNSWCIRAKQMCLGDRVGHRIPCCRIRGNLFHRRGLGCACWASSCRLPDRCGFQRTPTKLYCSAFFDFDASGFDSIKILCIIVSSPRVGWLASLIT